MTLSGRQIVQIAAVPAGDTGMSGALYALCADGSLWILPRMRSLEEWRRIKPVPTGDPAPATEPA